MTSKSTCHWCKQYMGLDDKRFKRCGNMCWICEKEFNKKWHVLGPLVITLERAYDQIEQYRMSGSTIPDKIFLTIEAARKKIKKIEKSFKVKGNTVV